MTWNVTKLDLHMFLYRNNFTCTPAHLQMKHSVSSTDFKVIRHVNLYDVWYEDSIIFMSEIRTSNHKPSHNPKTFSRGFITHRRLENSPSIIPYSLANVQYPTCVWQFFYSEGEPLSKRLKFLVHFFVNQHKELKVKVFLNQKYHYDQYLRSCRSCGLCRCGCLGLKHSI